MSAFKDRLSKDKANLERDKGELTQKLAKQEAKLTPKLHEGQRKAVSQQITKLQTEITEIEARVQQLDTQHPPPFWIRQCQSVQNRALREYVTENKTWDTLALGKILTMFMPDVFAPILGVSGDMDVHAAKEMVFLFSNVMEQRSARAHGKQQHLSIANVLDAMRCMHESALRCQRVDAEHVDDCAVTELGALREQTAACNYQEYLY